MVPKRRKLKEAEPDERLAMGIRQWYKKLSTIGIEPPIIPA